MESLSADLVARWRDGDQQAAAALFDRYVDRLLALARGRLSARFARHLDADEVVQSAYRSFFSGARDGRYTVRGGDDLWRLLAAITMHKLQHKVERLATAKRAVARERHFGGESSLFRLPAQLLAREPTPSHAAALADSLEQALRGLTPFQRHIAELRLQGWLVEEIAVKVERSERTVRRVLEEFKARLEGR